MEEHDHISTVYSIFIDFFGKENVDLQGQTIIVHFPKVTVTNEHDRSVDITHLWVKVNLSADGTIGGAFQMMRSELTAEQFVSGYSHSHIHNINSENFNRWASPCLGEGPIRATIASLSAQFSEEMWNLFCLELSKYVTVESLTGVPYMYLEKIGIIGSTSEKIKFPFEPLLNDRLFFTDEINNCILGFVSYILSKRPFGFNFINGSYGIAIPEKDIFIILSNLFIEYYNSLSIRIKPAKEELFEQRVVNKGKCTNNKLYYIRNNTESIILDNNQLIGRELFRFKNKTITFNITGIRRTIDDDPNLSIFLNCDIVKVIINKILKTINNKYGKPTQEIDFSGETHRYI